jgi:hypothetical protein
MKYLLMEYIIENQYNMYITITLQFTFTIMTHLTNNSK